MFKIINGKLHHYGHDGSLLAIVEEAHWDDYADQVPAASDFLIENVLQEPANGQETPPAP